jgi:glycosyltransferase involved in cell wall biosynthesis
MPTLTVIILTKNEAANIVPAIKNAQKCGGQVLVVDSGSTDETVQLAIQAGAKTCYRAWNQDFAAQRNFALTQTETDWVLYLDADERMEDKFVQAVQQIIATNVPVQGAMLRTVVAFGHTYTHGIFAPDQTLRLFPRTKVVWANKVHEHPVCACKKVVLPGTVLHFTYRDWHQWVAKINDYTTIWAQDNFAQGKRASCIGSCGHAIYGFLRAYVLQAGFLDGWAGFNAAVQHGYYTFLKYVKLRDLQRKS